MYLNEVLKSRSKVHFLNEMLFFETFSQSPEKIIKTETKPLIPRKILEKSSTTDKIKRLKKSSTTDKINFQKINPKSEKNTSYSKKNEKEKSIKNETFLKIHEKFNSINMKDMENDNNYIAESIQQDETMEKYDDEDIETCKSVDYPSMLQKSRGKSVEETFENEFFEKNDEFKEKQEFFMTNEKSKKTSNFFEKKDQFLIKNDSCKKNEDFKKNEDLPIEKSDFLQKTRIDEKMLFFRNSSVFTLKNNEKIILERQDNYENKGLINEINDMNNKNNENFLYDPVLKSFYDPNTQTYYHNIY